MENFVHAFGLRGFALDLFILFMAERYCDHEYMVFIDGFSYLNFVKKTLPRNSNDFKTLLRWLFEKVFDFKTHGSF